MDTEGLATLPGQVGQLPSDFDAVAQEAAEREFGIIPIIPAPIPLDKRTGTALVPAERAAAQVGTQGALPSPPRALRGPQGALSGPQDALPASQKRLPPPRSRAPGVEGDIEGIIDAADGPIKQTTFAGRNAIEFDMGPDHVIMTDDGKVAISSSGGEIIEVRDPSILERVKRFLRRYGAEFKTFARLL